MSALPRKDASAAGMASQGAGPGPIANVALELARLEQVIRKTPTNLDALLRAAGLMQLAGRMEEASKLLTQAATAAPGRPEPIVAQAELLRANAMHDEAIDLLQHAIEKDPAVPALWHAMAQTVLALADLDNAGTFFDEALRLDPDFHLCRLQRAALHLRRGQAPAAFAHYDRLRQIVPNDPGVLVGWGDAKTAMGERSDARVAYSAALGLVHDAAPIVDRLQRLAVMEFSYPLPHADLPPARKRADAMAEPRRIDIVFFHIDLAGTTAAPFEKPDYQAMLAQSAAIARHRAPGARVVLLTDEHTRLSADLRADRVVRSRIENVELMVDRLRLARDFLASGDAAENVVFIDSDVAVNRDPSEIFDGSFDVALTWRSDPPDNPFNAGVVLCRTGPAAVRFYDHLIAALGALEKHPASIARFGNGGLRRWWGDQLAMAATVGWTEFARRQSDRLAVDGTVVRFLPADDYNFAIDTSLPTPRGLDRRFFVHFKGSRKAGLASHADAVLASPPSAPAAATASDRKRDAGEIRSTPRELHVCLGNFSPLGQKTLIDFLQWLWAGFDELGFKVTTSPDQLREDVPNIIFEWRNHRFQPILDRNRGKLKLICFVTEIIKGDRFDDAQGTWDGRTRLEQFLSIAEHYTGFLTSVPSNVDFLRHIAPATFFEFGYAERLLALSDWRSWKHDFSCSGAMTPHRRKFLADVASQIIVTTPGDPKHHTAELVSTDDYVNLIRSTAINICLKQHPTWQLPSATRLARIVHSGVGCAMEATAVETTQSRYFPKFKGAEDFLQRFANVDRQRIAADAHERLSLYRAGLPMSREIERNIAECPPLLALT